MPEISEATFEWIIAIILAIAMFVAIAAAIRSRGGSNAIRQLPASAHAMLELNGESFTLDHTPYLIGRDSRSKVAGHLNPYTSNEHAILEFRVGAWWVTDKSRNGTELNGERLERDQRQRLHHEDSLKFADRDLGQFQFSRAQRAYPDCDDYLITRVINQDGGFSVIYQAEPKRPSVFAEVALKVSKPYKGEVGDARRMRFAEEYRHLQMVYQRSNDLFARPLGLVTMNNGEVGIAMQLLRGQTLHDYMHRLQARKRVETAYRLGLDLIETLAILQACGIVHSDVKPENIIRCEDGRHRLIDFGIAVKNGDPSHRFKSHLYASPEHLRNGILTGASDVYSVGCVLYHVLAGKALFYECSTKEEIREAHFQREPADIAATVQSQAGQQLAKLVMEMLNKEPRDRPSIDRLRNAWSSEVIRNAF